MFPGAPEYRFSRPMYTSVLFRVSPVLVRGKALRLICVVLLDNTVKVCCEAVIINP
jgi:hypothetical protein